jgi:uncharacterized membrane protein YbhN (UPF0104 family)
VGAALAIYADAGKLGATIGGFQWAYLPAILGLTLGNYLLRFLKWHYYLGQIGVRGLGWGDSCALFFSGLSMVVTPGKVGEWLKSYFLRAMTGTPFFRSAPVIIAERLTDGLAMVLLATGGLVLHQVWWQLLAVVVAGTGGILVCAWWPPLAAFGFAIAERLPVLGPKVAHLEEFYRSSRTIFGPRNLMIGTGLGFLSWGGECLAYYLVVLGLGGPEGTAPMVNAAFILAVSSLGGSLLLMPGGLGVAEGGITGLAQLLLGLSPEAAVASAVLIRLSTLWFGVGIGWLMLLVVTRRLQSGAVGIPGGPALPG